MATGTTTINVVKATDGPATVVKTTYETKTTSQYVADTSSPSYRSMIAPRNIIIQRSNIGGSHGGSGNGGSSSRTVERSIHYGALSSTPPGKTQTWGTY
jgi:hypothetical protein